jgi:hypothetical protein
MSTFHITGKDSGKDFEATLNRKFPHQWKVTIGDRTRRGWGLTHARATGNLLWALRTWSWPWYERARINMRAWVEALAEIPLAIYRADKAMFDLGDGKARE